MSELLITGDLGFRPYGTVFVGQLILDFSVLTSHNFDIAGISIFPEDSRKYFYAIFVGPRFFYEYIS